VSLGRKVNSTCRVGALIATVCGRPALVSGKTMVLAVRCVCDVFPAHAEHFRQAASCKEQQFHGCGDDSRIDRPPMPFGRQMLGRRLSLSADLPRQAFALGLSQDCPKPS
jgi:hypothetical protein